MKIFFTATIALLLIVASLAVNATSDKNFHMLKKQKEQKLLLALPSSMTKDHSIVELPPKVGLEFGDFSVKSDAEIQSMLVKTFPLLLTNSSSSKISSNKQEELQVELLRFAIFENALILRSQAGDDKVLKKLFFAWKCDACKFAVKHLVSFLTDKGCDYAGDAISKICASIPVVGPFSVPVCAEVLKWACGKIADDVEHHITSPTKICDHVFHMHC